MKILNGLIITIISILLVLSLVAFVLIHWNLADYSISLSPDGMEIYLTALGQYKALFTGTIATCAAYFGLLRVKVSEDANREKVKQDIFSEWKLVVQVRSAEVERNDLFMIREIIRLRRPLFNRLYELDFNVQNNAQLTDIFNEHISNMVNFFETQNNKHIGMGGAYPNDQYSYSYDSFRFIFFGMIEAWYDNLENDLRTLYINNLPADRHIDKALYKPALSNYRPIQ